MIQLYVACRLKNSQPCVRQNPTQTIYHLRKRSKLTAVHPVTHREHDRISSITGDHNRRLRLWPNSLNLLECFDNLLRCFIFDKLFLGQRHADGSASLPIIGDVDDDAAKNERIGNGDLLTTDNTQFGSTNLYIFYHSRV